MADRAERVGFLSIVVEALVVLSLGAAALNAAAAGSAEKALAGKILEATGVKGGLVVHVGCGDGKLTAALRASDSYLVHGLEADAKNVRKAREHIRKLGLCGKVSVRHWTGDRPGYGTLRRDELPYIDNLVNLLVAEDLGKVAGSEVLRVLAPQGVAYVKRDGTWRREVKPRPGDIDEWTHYLHDATGNAVARDARVGPPRHMQWLAEPMWSRNHHTLASTSALVSAAGRIFFIMDEGPPASMAVPGRWVLVARDAFSGVFLWKRPIASWAWHGHRFRSGPVQLPRTLVAAETRVYAPLGLDAPVTALDAATGQVVRTYKGTEGTEELVLNEGVLLVVVGSPAAEQAGPGAKGPQKAPFPNRKSIVAFRAETGQRLWKWAEGKTDRLMPLTLAAAGKRVFFQAGKGVVSLDRDTGRELWRSSPPEARKAAKPAKPAKAGGKRKGGRRRRGLGARSVGWSVATLVVHDPPRRAGGVVLWANGRRLSALSADSGKALWDCPSRAGFRSPTDLFVAGGLVWLGPSFTQGRDPRTGEVKKANATLKDLRTAGHHHRCYREKATDRYIMESHRGIEFLDLVGDNHSRNNWIRGLCQYGIMPCNGLVYAPPHACGCYMESKLYGFWAVAAERPARAPRAETPPLAKGPAYGQIRNPQSTIRNADDWPTYRHDPLRSGSTTTAVPARLAGVWQAEVGGRLSAPVAAGGTVVVASIDAHRVVALDAAGGKTRWAFTAGGRVDSPPTLHRGLVLFGCADGWVYCLRASDGEQVWRFHAAPDDRYTVARDQVESVWPVHGSVLVEGGPATGSGQAVAYVAAGRSSHLDGGIRLVGLDPATGRKLCEAPVRSRHPKGTEGASAERPKKLTQNAVDSKTFKAPDRSDAFSMSGTRSDVLVSDGASIYLRHLRFDRKCVQQAQKSRHLFSTSRLLDGAENHRSHWVLGTGDFSRTPVAYSWIANSASGRYGSRLSVPYGVMLAFDAKSVWGVRRGGRGGGYTLFAEANRPFSADEEPLPDFRKAARATPPKRKWSVPLPFRPRALLRAGDVLLLAGMPDPAKAEDPYAVLAGRKGGRLWAVSAADGKKLTDQKLAAPPVWDGMAAARGRLYLSTTDGKVLCMGRSR